MDARRKHPRTFRAAGRSWRTTDPAIPEKLRVELVKQLMDARRAVKHALAADDDAAERTARARVQDAKVALGERGAPWWSEPSDAAREERATAAIRALLRQRGADKTICPSDVARVLAGDDFAQAMALVRRVVNTLTDDGELEVRQRGAVVDAHTARGPIRVALRPST